MHEVIAGRGDHAKAHRPHQASMVTGHVLPLDAGRTPRNDPEMCEHVPYKDAGAMS